MICPKCGSNRVVTERRPNGYTICLNCPYRVLSKDIQKEPESVDKGFLGSVKLIGLFGDDRTIANAAWVCTDRERDADREELERLIKFLAINRHGTPFEHVVLRFDVTCPIFVARQWLRHRVGTFNEKSLRYVKSDGNCYIPVELNEKQLELYENAITIACSAYEQIIELAEDKRRGREIARGVLPLSLYTRYHWTVNLRALANFLRQRLEDHAQIEIRNLAQEIERILKETKDIEIAMKHIKSCGWNI